MKSQLHIAALQWAAAGFFVFPCLPGRKEPAISNNLELATADAAQIDTWWTENPDYNIGCAPDKSGNIVLDVDPPLGFVSLQALVAAKGSLQRTLTISTPRGGVHLWFDGQGPSTASKLGPKIDTRGAGGYVLMPPSSIAAGAYENNPNGGAYVVTENIETAPLPAWVEEGIISIRTNQLSGTDDLDTVENIGRLRATLERLVAKGDVAIAESGGKDRTYRLCCTALDLGVSVEKAEELIFEIWNPACRPPWDRNDPEGIELMLGNASKYRQNEIGAYAIPPATETYAHIAAAPSMDDTSGDDGDGEEDVGRTDGKSHRYHFRSIAEQNARAPTEWLIEPIIPKCSIGFMYGDSDSFKTFLALDMCLGLAAGVSTFGSQPGAPVETAYIAGEGPAEIETKRRPSWQLVRGASDDIMFFTIDEMPTALDGVQVFLDTAKAEGRSPRLVVIDTAFWFGGGLNLNDGKDVGVMMIAAKVIKKKLQCAVLIVHHIGKTDAGMTGSRHLFGASDFVIEVRRLPNTMFVTAQMTKQKDAEKRAEPWYFKGHPIASSLVFDPCDAAEYMQAVDAGRAVTIKHIGTILKRMDARGIARGLSSSVIATELGRDHGGDEKQYLADLKAMVKKECDGNLYDPVAKVWCLVG